MSWGSRGAGDRGPRRDQEARGRNARRRGFGGKGRSSGQPLLCPASGPPSASDPDATAGLGAVSALRAAPSPQPAGSTGESGPCPRFSPCNTLCPPAQSLANHLSRPAFSTPHSALVGPAPRGLHFPTSPVPLSLPSPPCRLYPFPGPLGPPALVGPASPPWPRSPVSAPDLTHGPRLRFWTAGGSQCWTRCGPACRWDPERCPLASPCTRTSSGRAWTGVWAGGPHPLCPGHNTPFSQATAAPPGIETLPFHGGALWGSR